MKRLIPMVLLAATVAGCKSPQMKSTPFYSGSERVYTGKPEDRVNLWPIGYYREPALSVLWPLFSLTDDHLAVRPVYSQYRQGGKDSDYDEFNLLWPICQFDTRSDEHRIFPLYWGDRHVDLFPLVWWRFDKSFTLFPLAWWKKDRYFNVFPLWWSDRSHKLFIPFYYQDENSLTVLPFYGKTSHLDNFTEWYGPYGRHRDEKSPELNYDWCFPFYYRDATSFETPLFGWDRNDRSSWALPLYYKDHNDFVSLPWISGTNSSGDEEWIAPLLLSGGASGTDKSMFFSPVWYSRRDGKTNSSSWAVPPLLSWGWDDKDGSCDEYLLGLAGRGTDAEGRARYWTFPFFYRDDRTFLSTFWCAGRDEQATADYWAVPPLLSWGSHGDAGWSQRYLLGLAGVEREKDGGYADWVAPLYYRSRDSFFSIPYCSFDDVCVIPPLLTVIDDDLNLGNPLFGWCDSYNWAFPLWYKDDKTFASLPYFSTTENLGNTTNTTTVIPPLLSWFERTGDGYGESRLLFGLGGWNSVAGRGVSKSWMFPLWYEDDEMFASLPYVKTEDTTIIPPLLSWFERTRSGRSKSRLLLGLLGWDSQPDKAVCKSWMFPLYYSESGLDGAFISLLFAHAADFTCVTPLFGVTHGQDKKGAWLWPIYGWTNDTDMEAAEAQLNAPTLDSKIGVEKHEAVFSKGRTNRWYEVTGETRAHDSSWRLSGLSTSDHWINWSASADGRTVSGHETSDFGNFFAYKSDYNRTVKFDYTTKKKISDEENGESGLLCNFLWHSKHEAREGHAYDKRSILWRFWHYERLNGDVTVDSFPFFTYDSKTNGFSKTSLLWRLFRNEYDPKEGKRKVDVLFVPVWR